MTWNCFRGLPPAGRSKASSTNGGAPDANLPIYAQMQALEAQEPIKPSSQHGKQDRSASQGRRSLAGLEGAAWRASLDASVRNGAAYLLRPTDAGSVHDGSKHGGSARSMRHSAGGAMEATQPKPALAGRSSLSDPQCNVTFEKAYTAAARSEALERAMMASLAAEAPGRMMHSEPCNISNWAVAGKGGPSAMCSGGHAHRGEGEGEGAADLDAAPHELDTGSSLSSMFCRGASNELLPVAQAPAQQAEGSAAAAAAAPAAALGAQAQAGVRQCPPPPWPLHVITLETLEQRRQPSPAPGTPPSASSNSASPRLHVAMPSPLRQGQGQGQGVPRAQSLQLIKHMAATAPNSSGRLSVESGRPCSDVQLELEAVRMALEVSSELSGLDVPSSPSKTSPHASGPPSHGAARPHSATGLRHPLGSPFGVLHAQQQVEPHSPTARAPSCGPASAAGLTVDCLSRHDSNSNNAAAAAQLCGLPTSPSCSSQWGRDADEVLALSFFQRTSNPGTRPAAGVTSHPLDSRHSGLMSPTYSLSRCASPAVHSGSFVVHSGSHAHVPLVPEWLDRSVHIRRDGPHLTSSWPRMSSPLTGPVDKGED